MTFQEAKSHLGLSKTPSRELGRDLASPEPVVGRSRRVITAAAPFLASTNKCLTLRNKSADENNATKRPHPIQADGLDILASDLRRPFFLLLSVAQEIFMPTTAPATHDSD
ncbi:MAG: hypothetical protein WBW73_24455 [Rhodoplanes sp.]